MTDIRIRQLVVPTGVGSITHEVTGKHILIRSLDSWHRIRNVSDIDQEFVIDEPRLKLLLGIEYLIRPPDFRISNNNNNNNNNNNYLTIPVFRFPTFWFCRTCGSVKKTSGGESLTPNCPDNNCHSSRRNTSMVQVPLVMACEKGCISEIPWRKILNCPAECSQTLKLIGSGTILDKRILCPEHKREGVSLQEVLKVAGYNQNPPTDSGLGTLFHRNTGEKLCCPGIKTWQSLDTSNCTGTPSASFLNSLSLHNTNTITSIYLPIKLIKETDNNLIKIILNYPGLNFTWKKVQKFYESGISLDFIKDDIKKIVDALASNEATQQISQLPHNNLIERLIQANSSEISTSAAESNLGNNTLYRFQEHQVLLENHDEQDFVTELQENPDLDDLVESIVRVRRLRQTIVGLGFYRLGQKPNQVSTRGLVKNAIKQYHTKYKDLADHDPLPQDAWLPAVSSSGEGILISLSNSQLRNWWSVNKDSLTKIIQPVFNSYSNEFQNRNSSPVRNAEPAPLSLEWFGRYTLIHTLSHILMLQVSFDCGYSIESLAERLYVSCDRDKPMSSFLIYTAAGDSQGSLGGLAALADPNLLASLFKRSLQRATCCTSDPICTETANLAPRGFNGAACHCCAMVPDLCCESANMLLDRRLLIDPVFGFANKLI